MIVVACPAQGEVTNPEALKLAFHYQGSAFILAYCQAVTSLVDQESGWWG